MTNATHAPSSLACRAAAFAPAGLFLAAFAAMPIGPSPRRRAARPPARRRARICSALVIGGPAAQQRFCQTLLEALGLRVAVADDFHAATRALAAGPHELLILDAQTRGFDPDVWLRVLEAAEASFGSGRRIYVVAGAAEGPDPGPPGPVIAADGYLERPIRAIDLVRATEPLR